jgi:hypothetical protein
MRTTIRRDHIVDLVIGNRRPFAIDLDLVRSADHAALRRAAVHEITAGVFAVVSVELQVKVFMPPIVADPEISFLRRCVYMKRHEERAAEQRDDIASPHVLSWNLFWRGGWRLADSARSRGSDRPRSETGSGFCGVRARTAVTLFHRLLKMHRPECSTPAGCALRCENATRFRTAVGQSRGTYGTPAGIIPA